MRILNAMAARAIPFVPRSLIRRISHRYIAGATRAELIERVRLLHAAGYRTTIDVLGEAAASPAEVAATAAEYAALIEALHAGGLRSELSIKPSALGLLLDQAGCAQQVRRILDGAATRGVSACIDMEDLSCTGPTLALFAQMEAAGHDVGLALQAYLRRTDDDVAALGRRRSRVRICKGIYAEAPAQLVAGAARDRTAINAPFMRHVTSLLQAGSFVAIATHDAALIEALTAWLRRERIDASRFEFQMLLGVCEPLREQLRASGFPVRVYVPYGQDWYGYSTRRIRENPRIAGYVLKAWLRGE